MEAEKFNEEDKKFIAKQIKNITIGDVEEEMNKLIQIGCNAHTISSRSRTGNNVVDYFTFRQRLETKGKYGVCFFEFIERIDEFKKRNLFKQC